MKDSSTSRGVQGSVHIPKELKSFLFEEDETPKMDIPLTMKGKMVGMGTLRKDGTFLAQVNPTEEGAELWSMLTQGTANCISLGPNPDGPTGFSASII